MHERTQSCVTTESNTRQPASGEEKCQHQVDLGSFVSKSSLGSYGIRYYFVSSFVRHIQGGEMEINSLKRVRRPGRGRVPGRGMRGGIMERKPLYTMCSKPRTKQETCGKSTDLCPGSCRVWVCIAAYTSYFSEKKPRSSICQRPALLKMQSECPPDPAMM